MSDIQTKKPNQDQIKRLKEVRPLISDKQTGMDISAGGSVLAFEGQKKLE